MPAPRKYDDETRARAVRMYRDRIADHGESMIEARRQVGALLDINPSTLRSWVERDEVDRGDRDRTTTAEAAEIRRLRKENAELRRANEILKTASVIRCELRQPAFSLAEGHLCVSHRSLGSISLQDQGLSC